MNSDSAYFLFSIVNSQISQFLFFHSMTFLLLFKILSFWGDQLVASPFLKKYWGKKLYFLVHEGASRSFSFYCTK